MESVIFLTLLIMLLPKNRRQVFTGHVSLHIQVNNHTFFIAENDAKNLEHALKKGFDVEIDVWYHSNQWFLGHDEPQHLVKSDFLTNDKLWCHAKNLQALEQLLKLGAHCFWHQDFKK